MAHASRVKIKVDDLPKEFRSGDNSKSEKDRIFRVLLRTFNKAVSNAGVLPECRQREFFESPGEKKRRKLREAIRERAKDKNKNRESN